MHLNDKKELLLPLPYICLTLGIEQKNRSIATNVKNILDPGVQTKS